MKPSTTLKWFFISLSLAFVNKSFAQTDFCNGAAPFCTGTTYNFPAPVSGTEAEIGPDYGCLFSQPNPVWYYLQIANNGTIVLDIAGASAIDDIDFACWGPFSSPTGGCAGGLTANCGFIGCLDNTDPFSSYPAGNLVDCSFDAQASEVCTIPNAVTGQYYMVLITNYGGNVTNIIFNQTNSGAGAGSTNCNILCNITNMTATPGPCIAGANTFDVTGTITTTAPPSSGTLTITNSCGGSTVINPPFTTSTNYTLTGGSATGGACSVTAAYSADATCTYTVNITAPAPCNATPCSISQVTATPGACVAATNTYSVTGTVTFTNPPASGTLSVTGSCGGTQTFNAPFVSPLTYTLTGLPADASACAITAAFSADALCTSNANYTAPASCSSCTVTANNSGPVCEGQPLNFSCVPSGATSYSWTGPNSYTSSVQNPSIISPTAAATGTYSVTATFPDGSVCNATTTATVNALPVADAGADVSVCIGNSVQLNGQGGAGYSWSPAASLDNPVIANPNASPAGTTTYSLTVTSAAGCIDTDDMTLSIITSVNAVVSPNSIICEGANTQLTSSGGSSYSWSPLTGLSNATISNPVASPTVTTTYSVIVSAGPGCPPDTNQVTVTVDPRPNVTVSANDTICVGETGVVHAYNAATYFWPGIGITGDSIISNPIVTTSYTVIGSIGNCTNTATGTIVVVPAPLVEFVTSTQEEPGNYVVTAENYSDTIYNSYWAVNSLDTLITPLFQYDFKQAGTYTICLYGENSRGCPATDCKEIILKGDWSLYIPNAFSPNSDGTNDVFYCYGINFTDYELSIFDRWGELVYKSTDVKEGWKGDIKKSGTIAKVDTYIYKVKIVDSEKRKRTFNGQVHLIR